jgi:peptide/nickel transport system permease protein
MSEIAITATPDAPVSQYKGLWPKLRRNRMALIGLVMLVIVALCAIFAPLFAPVDPNKQDLTNSFKDPTLHYFLKSHGTNWKWIMGTDPLGRDIFSRVIYGTRLAILIGLVSIAAAFVIGVALGVMSGYMGRVWDGVIMRTADVFLAFPVFLGAILIVQVVGTGVTSVIVAIALFSWAAIARLLRANVLVTRETEYVQAAESLGASPWRIIRKHILPNSLAPVLIFSALTVATAVVAASSLNFLGIGVKPGTAEWGAMINEARPYFETHAYMWLAPAIAVVFTVLAFVFVGDGIRDALDPKSQ